MSTIQRICLVLTIIGAINWGLIGFFQFDLVAAIFGGQGSALSRIIYGLVGIAGLINLGLLFKPNEERSREEAANPEMRQDINHAEIGFCMKSKAPNIPVRCFFHAYFLIRSLRLDISIHSSSQLRSCFDDRLQNSKAHSILKRRVFNIMEVLFEYVAHHVNHAVYCLIFWNGERIFRV